MYMYRENHKPGSLYAAKQTCSKQQPTVGESHHPLSSSKYKKQRGLILFPPPFLEQRNHIEKASIISQSRGPVQAHTGGSLEDAWACALDVSILAATSAITSRVRSNPATSAATISIVNTLLQLDAEM